MITVSNGASSDEFIKSSAAAEFLKTTTANLARMRYEKKGPIYYKLGGRAIRYTIRDLTSWIEEGRVDPKVAAQARKQRD